MPRKPIIRSRDHFYHVTARSNNKEHFFLSVDQVWDVMSSHLVKLQKEHGIQIGAFVLMSNHFHLLVRSPNIDIDRFMYFFMKRITIEIQRRTDRINKIFGGRYKGSLIDNFNYLANVYKYIYRNPVAANIVTSAEYYVYSSLFFSLNQDPRLKFELTECLVPEINSRNKLSWINHAFNPKAAESIKVGLKKTHFSYGKSRVSGKEIEPE